jgi:hypothetical protein
MKSYHWYTHLQPGADKYHASILLVPNRYLGSDANVSHMETRGNRQAKASIWPNRQKKQR